jgi:thiol-disulfide isomerase/thioredoxin|uniref:Thioredoxin domain-containing protein n=1 Tax=viral metagenome TaxID=1070528 RepID=A0A6C0EDD3_9ZZZZ
MINHLIENYWFWLSITLFFVFIIYLNYNIYDTNYSDCNVHVDGKRVQHSRKDCNVYLFYAEWCPHCKHFMPEWNKFTNMVDSSKINVKMINDCEDSELCKKYKIDRFPTIIFENNDKYDIYNGNLKATDLNSYLLNM